MVISSSVYKNSFEKSPLKTSYKIADARLRYVHPTTDKYTTDPKIFKVEFYHSHPSYSCPSKNLFLQGALGAANI